MSALFEQAFGSSSVDLYEDVLKVAKDCSLAQLRKGYYQQARKYHPDKNPGVEAKLKFQAISWAYQLLKDPEKRADYDNDGVIPSDDHLDSDDQGKGPNSWKSYFDQIFGKLSTDDIDQFAMKYKMSEEEEKDVLENYQKFKGNLAKMLEYVMLSEERDVPRWVEDYIRPAIVSGKVTDYSKTLASTLATIKKRLDKDEAQDTSAAVSDEETETEESSEDDQYPATKSSSSGKKKLSSKKAPPKKAKPTKAKKKAASQLDLISAIRNKRRSNPLASLGARYGVSMEDDDPLDDAAFAKIQSKFKNRK